MTAIEDIDRRYDEALRTIDEQYAAFHKVGSAAYDPSLATSLAIDESFGSPSQQFRSVHIAGTNGKGSTAHTLAAILTAAGYRTGLYTSPHITNLRERIRIDGRMIEKEAVVDFIDRWNAMPTAQLHPSFFELITAMAFDYFSREKVDIAVVETGLGGRLDSTNIITPELSIITNISLDHTAILGPDPASIAREKAGIIKPGVPAVIGEADGDVRAVFQQIADERHSPIIFAEDLGEILGATDVDLQPMYTTRHHGRFRGQLSGEYQVKNAATVLAAVDQLISRGWNIGDRAIAEGFGSVATATGLVGRWTVVDQSPLTVVDTGHNPGGWQYLARRLAAMGRAKDIVVGFVADKDVATVVGMMTAIPDARFHLTQPSNSRALPAAVLARIADEHGLNVASVSSDVASAYRKARSAAGSDGFIFAGGSTFVVADLFAADLFAVLNRN